MTKSRHYPDYYDEDESIRRDPEETPAAMLAAIAKKNPAAVALGRLGGKASKGKTSDAKKHASRENGKKGGRPKKATPSTSGASS